MSEQLEFEFVIDDSDAKKKYDALEKQGKDAAKKISDTFAKDDSLGEKKAEKLNKELKNAKPEAESLGTSLVKSAGAWALALASVDTAIKLIKLPFLGEQLLAIDAQFNRIAADAGLSGGKMKDAFEEAGRGLVDIDDLLVSATSAIINLGGEAGKLPQVLELSRRITQTLGGDIQDRFQGIVQAIETGNARLLRQNGIILDVDKVLKDYARSLGLAVGELTQANRQQALLNAALTEGEKKFKDGEGSIKPLTEATTRLKIAVGDVVEGFGKLAAVNLQSSGITGFIERLAQFTKASNLDNPYQQQARDAADLQAQILRLQANISNYKTELAALNPITAKFFSGPIEAKIFDTTRLLDSLQLKFEALKATVTSATETKGAGTPDAGGAPPPKPPPKFTDEQLAALAARNLEVNRLETQANAQSLAAAQQRADGILDQDQRVLIQKSIFGQQLLNEGAQLNNELAALDAKRDTDTAFTTALYNRAREVAIQNSNNRVTALNEEFAKKQKQQWVSLASTAQNVFSTQMGTAFQAFGAALAKGEDAGKAFQNAMIGIFGDIAIQLGNFYIAKGIAISADPLTPGSGIGLIAAGAALNVLGGALKASAGGGSAGSTASAGAGGGGFTGGTDTLTPTAPEDVQAAEPKTTISVNVNGNILGTSDRSLGLAISEILSDQFSSQGLVLKG